MILTAEPNKLWFDESKLEGISKQGDSYILCANNYNDFRNCLENLISGETQEFMQTMVDSIATNPDNEYTMRFLGLDELVLATKISPDAERMIKIAEANLESPVFSEESYVEYYNNTKTYLSNLPESESLLDIFERGSELWGPVYIQTFLKEKLEKLAETSQDRTNGYKAAASSMRSLLNLSKSHYNPEKGAIFNYKTAQDFLFAKNVQLFVTPNIAKGILNKVESARKEFENKYNLLPTGLKFDTNGQGFVFDKVNGSYQKVEFDLEASPKVCKTILQCYDANLQNYLQ
jgi:hypothetical protein